MSIYPSTKPAPYVYHVYNPSTGEFYFGYRYANDEPSHIDFPKYKTSSSAIKPNFEQFNWQILAEFFDSDSAYDFEQQMIFENWGNPLLLNGHYNINSNARFKRDNKGESNPNFGKRGPGTTSHGKRWTLTEEQCEKRRGMNSHSYGKPGAMKGRIGELHHNYGKSQTKESNAKRSKSLIGVHVGKVTCFDLTILIFVQISSEEYQLYKNKRYVLATSKIYKERILNYV